MRMLLRPAPVRYVAVVERRAEIERTDGAGRGGARSNPRLLDRARTRGNVAVALADLARGARAPGRRDEEEEQDRTSGVLRDLIAGSVRGRGAAQAGGGPRHWQRRWPFLSGCEARVPCADRVDWRTRCCRDLLLISIPLLVRRVFGKWGVPKWQNPAVRGWGERKGDAEKNHAH